MYYYIVDPPKSVQTAKIVQRLQELVTPLGISGEISIANPARSAEELAYMGIDKGYTTIIAVGGEDLANTIATILLNESREKIAFGIIPLNAGPLIPQMIGVANNDLRAATEIIKQRHLDLVDLVQISSKRFMFTEAEIVAPRKIKITLDIDQLTRAELEADYVHIDHDLVVTIAAQQPQSFLQKTFSFIGKSETNDKTFSRFHGKQIRLVAHEPLPILVAGQVVAKTPTTLTKIPAALKLITTRAILPQKTISDLPLRTPAKSGEVYQTASELRSAYPRAEDQRTDNLA